MNNLDQTLTQINRADEETVTRQLAKQSQLPYVSLVGYPILPHTLGLISYDQAKDHHLIPYLRVGSKLKLATSQTPAPETLRFIQDLANQLQAEISLSLCSSSSLAFALNLSLLQAQKQGHGADIDVTTQEQTAAIQAIHSKEELTTRLASANATQVLDLFFSAATGMEASDIHLEPEESGVRVRFRIDGVLQEVTTLPPAIYKQVVSRVKYLAKIKLDVKSVGQDGRFTITTAATTLDVRVSTLPSAFGEIIDMRLLRSQAQFIRLDELNLTAPALAQIKEALALPHGMILVTGPTGSGKTTTLYAILDYLNQTGIKIVTLEDPIEYRLKGIDQVQIETAKGFTFAQALRSVLRQDPDIIMVGEIRDKETAEIGLQSATTGHLFLSTLHTNNAPASLARLIDMGVEPYKIAGAINLIIAQRLVRQRCTTCHGAGCEVCNQTGYKGRLPIIEIIKPSRALDEALIKRASVRELYSIALQEGMVSMHEDGLAKVSQGLTTEAEVERVTAELDQD